MTAHELLKSLTFDEVIEPMQHIRSGRYAVKNEADYKAAFDYICNLESGLEKGFVDFCVSPREDWPKQELSLITYQIEGIVWEDVICRKVIRPKEVEVSDSELATSILWEMTLFGFSDEPFNITENFNSGEYGVRACELEHKLYLPYIRDKSTKRYLRAHHREPEPFGIGFTWKVSQLNIGADTRTVPNANDSIE